MILVQETWTTQYCQLYLNGYIYHNYPRKSKDPKAKRASGGIGIFIKSDILNIEIVDISKSDNVDYKYRNILSKFRLSSHCLNIEQGRHKKPKVPLENRICHNCSMNMVEDEIHFLLQCPCYDNIRIPLFKKISEKHHDFKNMSQQEQFIFIMSSKDTVFRL